jgi:hypothetical protein
MHWLDPPSKVTTAQVFAIAGPAMVREPDHAAERSASQAARKIQATRRYTGQSSAVMVAASAPTISDSDSRPVRNSVEARSFLMFSTSPSPL